METRNVILEQPPLKNKPVRFTEIQGCYREDEDLLVAKCFAEKLHDPQYKPSFDEMRVVFTEFVCQIKMDSGHHQAGINLLKKMKIGDLEPQKILPNLEKHGDIVRFDYQGKVSREISYASQLIVPIGDIVFPNGVSTNSDYVNYALDVVGNKVFKRAEGTDDYNKFIKWYLNDYEGFIKNISDPENQNMILSLALSGLSRDAYSKNNLFAAEELVKSLHRMSTSTVDKTDKLISTVDSILGLPSIAGYFDAQLLISRGLVSLQGTEAGDVVTGYLISRYGLASAVDRFRKLLYSEKLSSEEKIKVKDWLLNFWKVTVPANENSVIPKDVNEFYDMVPEEANPMTEKHEGDTRIAFLLVKLREMGISKEDLILDIAGGNGWLANRLKSQGHNVAVVDNNDTLLNEARKRGVNAYRGDMFEINSLVSRQGLNPTVEIINGRSIHHIHEISDLDRFRSDVVIFDVLDPNTGVQKDRINKIRDYLVEKHGFNRKWVDKYYWNILSSIDEGKHLMDRFCPPEEWWIDQMNLNGYQVEVTREYNYDKKNTDNLVVVSKKIDDPKIKEQVVNDARERIRKRQSDAREGVNLYYRGTYADWGY